MVVDMVVFLLQHDGGKLSWDISVSKGFAAEVAIINNFIWNEVWTFKDIACEGSNSPYRLSRFAKFNFICLAGIGISILLLNAQVRLFHWNVYMANAFAILAASLWNFCMNLRFSWKKNRMPSEKSDMGVSKK